MYFSFTIVLILFSVTSNTDTVRRGLYYFQIQEWEPDCVHITKKLRVLMRQLHHFKTTVMEWVQWLQLIRLTYLLFWDKYVPVPISLVLKQTCTDHLYFLTWFCQEIIF